MRSSEGSFKYVLGAFFLASEAAKGLPAEEAAATAVGIEAAEVEEAEVVPISEVVNTWVPFALQVDDDGRRLLLVVYITGTGA